MFLWNVHIRIRQKIAIAVFLTMNVWLIVLAVLRVWGLKDRGVYDATWLALFQFLEPNVAILAASFSTFRSLFVRFDRNRHGQGDGERLSPLNQKHSNQQSQWPGSDRSPWTRAFRQTSSEKGRSLSSFVPSSRTLLRMNKPRKDIVVTHDWSINSSNE